MSSNLPVQSESKSWFSHFYVKIKELERLLKNSKVQESEEDRECKVSSKHDEEIQIANSVEIKELKKYLKSYQLLKYLTKYDIFDGFKFVKIAKNTESCNYCKNSFH